MNTLNRNSFGARIRVSSLRNIILPVIPILLTLQLLAQDTINPFGIRTPFEITEPEPANFPFQYPEFIGDINGDGYGDFAVNRWAADERTDDPTDALYKSAVITNIHQPDSSQVFYGTIFKGIKDYNGDGYDDVLDIWNMVVYFGSEGGLTYDTLRLDYPFSHSDRTMIYYTGDISDDGKSELLISQNYLFDTVFIYSVTAQYQILEVNPELLFFNEITISHYYDYDSDGVKELAICGMNTYYFEEKYRVNWYTFDTVQHNLILEHGVNINMIQEPTVHFTQSFSDVNGDGRPDITHTYYTSTDKYSIEVNFGQDNSPYFSEPVDIPAGNLHRLFYVAGDVNNDGADDWYSLTDPDSVTIYFGNQDIANQGFIKEKYYTGANQLLYPLGKYFNFTSAMNIPVFYFDPDSIPDILMNFWNIDENLRFDTIGCAIICGGDSLAFDNPLVFGRKADKSYPELQYGYRTTTLGDINNDGIEDWGTLALMDCYAEVFFGSTEFNITPDIRILLPQVERTACYDWSSGDLNDDGLIDLAISNSSEMDVMMVPGVFNELNRVFVFYGRENWPSVLSYKDADEIVEDTTYFHEFGSNIGIIGDYNGDGYDDMVIGGVRYTTTNRKAYLYLGGHFIPEQPDMVLSMPGSGSSFTFGDPITACGDINDDGFDDFTLGDSHFSQSLIYFGGYDADDQYDAAIKDPSGGGGTNFGGFTVRNKGDYDGDGYPDLVQTSYFPIDGAFIFKGGPEFDTIFDYQIGDTSIYYMGPEMVFIESFTDKGKSDLIIGQYNSFTSSIFSHVESFVTEPDYVLQNDYGSTFGIASGDFDNDGYVEICTGHSRELNYGNPRGGIIQFYRSPIFVSIDENNFQDGINSLLFPNPADDFVNITFSFTASEKIKIRIFDLSGKTLLTQTFKPENRGTTSAMLNLSSLPTGMYIVRIETSTSSSAQKLIISR